MEKKIQNHKFSRSKMSKSYIFAFISIFVWASTATVTKLLLEDLNSIQILCVSMFFASLTLLIANVFLKKLSIIKQYKIKDYITFFLTGVIGVFCYYLFLYLALFYLPAQEGFIINYLWPVMIIIFARILLKEKLTPKKLLAIILSFIGVAIVVTKGNFAEFDLSNPLGVILAVLAAVSYGLFSVIVKKYTYDKTISMMFYCISALVVSSLVMIVTSGVPTLNAIQILGLGWMGIFTTAIGFTAWAFALKYGHTHKIANLAFVTPFLSLVYIYLFLGEQINIYSVIGLIVIVLGILIQNIEERKRISDTS